MNEVVIVVIAIVALIAAVIIYGIVSTTMGYEEDVNKNYIPDRLERMLGADPKPKEDKVIVFDGKYKHCQGVPKLNEKRIVLVANYI